MYSIQRLCKERLSNPIYQQYDIGLFSIGPHKQTHPTRSYPTSCPHINPSLSETLITEEMGKPSSRYYLRLKPISYYILFFVVNQNFHTFLDQRHLLALNKNLRRNSSFMLVSHCVCFNIIVMLFGFVQFAYR